MNLRTIAPSSLRLVLFTMAGIALSARGENPEKFYRAYWNSGTDLADFDALAAFYSEKALADLATIKKEAGDEAFKSMAAGRSEFIKGSTITSLKATTADDKSDLVLLIDPGEMGKERGVTSLNGEVELTRTQSGWRIESEDFFAAPPPRVRGQNEDCPPGYVLGSTEAPNVIFFRQTDGDRSVRFDNATLILEKGKYTLEIPGFHNNEWDIIPMGSINTRRASKQKVKISGQRSLEGCLAIPEEMRQEDNSSPEGTITFAGELPFAGAKTFTASFEFKAPGVPDIAIIGEIKSGKVISVAPKPLAGQGRIMDPKSGETVDIGSAIVTHYPHLNRLSIDYEYKARRGIHSGSFHVMEFSGETGVFLGKSKVMVDREWIEIVQVAIIDVFGEEDVRLELRQVAADQLPEGDLTLETARDIGVLNMQLNTDHLLVREPRARLR